MCADGKQREAAAALLRCCSCDALRVAKVALQLRLAGRRPVALLVQRPLQLVLPAHGVVAAVLQMVQLQAVLARSGRCRAVGALVRHGEGARADNPRLLVLPTVGLANVSFLFSLHSIHYSVFESDTTDGSFGHIAYL